MRLFSNARREMVKALGVAMIASVGTVALAQQGQYPNRPIKIIVPWPAGGGGDVIIRMMAPSLTKRLGQPIVVENKPGAMGTIGSLAAARSPADGYTIVYSTMDSHAIAPSVLKQAPYNPKTEFVTLAPLGSYPVGLVVHSSHPAKNLKEFLQMAKEAKDPMNFGSWSNADSGRFMMESMKQITGVNLTHIPYSGGAPLLQAQLAKQIDSSINVLASLEPHIRSGTFRLLAVSAPQRLPEFPDAPTLKEFGINIDRGPWAALTGPVGIPADVVTRLHDAIDATLHEPEIAAQLKKMVFTVEYSDQKAYQAFYLNDIDRWAQAVRAAKVTID